VATRCPLAISWPRRAAKRTTLSRDIIDGNAVALESVLQDFGVRGEIINARPGPVVTLYELEPAPGIKSSRVIGLADDIARSMSAVSARVAVVSGRNAIGIELPNPTREKVYLRELLTGLDYNESAAKLPLCLGKTIGGESVIVDLSRMPHLLIRAPPAPASRSQSARDPVAGVPLTPGPVPVDLVDPRCSSFPSTAASASAHAGRHRSKEAVVAIKWAIREM
jgi:S-DNA-T family DNA segregation ATPase FtsK/SpoIIIE